MQISDDQKHAILEIAGVFTAEQIESIIVQLAELRAGMKPEVARKAPHGSPVENLEASILLETDPRLTVALLRSGRFRFWFRNSGIGWQIYEVSARDAAGIANYIKSKIIDYEPLDLINQELPDGNGLQ